MSQPKPLPRQLAFQEAEFGLFCHFGPNTYLDQEWGDGTEDPAVVNPTEFDPRQWARAAKAAGMRYLCFTAKHHDGFCNWPTDTTDHSIQASPYRGDPLEQVAEACAAEGLLFGVYCSPWDRHDPRYPDPAAYDEVYLQQWRELLTRYGKLFCCWLDGAGSVGRVYDWERIIGQMRELQPEACIFNMGEPDYRWVGNEEGLAPDPCWNVLEAAADFNDSIWFTPAFARALPYWLPAEADARIRQNWFWNSYDLPTLKSTERLVDIYEKSVGHGCNLVLNCGPDPRGLLPEPDVARLGEMGAELRRRWGKPVGNAGQGSRVEGQGSGNDRGNGADTSKEVQQAVDGSAYGEEQALEIRFASPTAINGAICREDLTEGEHVREYQVQVMRLGRWESVYLGTAMGHQKIDHFPTVEAEAARVWVSRQEGEAKVRSLQVFRI
jgi:alpha-L-fucosidase